MHRQIYGQLRRAILNGEIPVKSRIPSSRDLARQLGISRTTVINAYDQLFAEGYLEGKVGSGTFVAAELPEKLLQIPKIERPQSAAFLRKLNLSKKGAQLSKNSGDILTDYSTVGFKPFQNGLTAIDSFPFDTWAKIAARRSLYQSAEAPGCHDSTGFRPLREAIAAHLMSARGVNCDSEQVIITTGAQQALALIASIFLGTGDEVLIEDPGYPNARNIFALSGAKLIPIAVDDNGFDLKSAIRQSKKPKLIYVTPSHQYPLGITMSLARRLSLIEWAKQNDAWIIEDDYDSEYRYSGHPLASLHGLDVEGRVLYVGTFSKTIFSSLKLGCLVVPPDLVNTFAAARVLSGAHSPLITQGVLAEFIAEGHFARHIRRMRTLYAERQRILVEAVKEKLGGLIEIKKSDAGMHLIGWLPAGIEDFLISQKAERQNVKLSPVSACCVNNCSYNGLIFGYAGFGEKQIREGIDKLSETLADMLQSKRISAEKTQNPAFRYASAYNR